VPPTTMCKKPRNHHNNNSHYHKSNSANTHTPVYFSCALKEQTHFVPKYPSCTHKKIILSANRTLLVKLFIFRLSIQPHMYVHTAAVWVLCNTQLTKKYFSSI